MGAVLAAAGFAAITYPLVQRRKLGWPTWIFAMLACGFIALAAFGWHQLRRHDRRIHRRTKTRRTMLIGTGIVFAGQIAIIATLAGAHSGFNAWWLSPALAVVGIGMGITMAPFFDIVLGAVTDAEAGSASGTLTAVQQVGGAIGVAVVGTVFFTSLGHTLPGQVASYARAANISIVMALILVAASFALTFLLPETLKPEPIAESH